MVKSQAGSDFLWTHIIRAGEQGLYFRHVLNFEELWRFQRAFDPALDAFPRYAGTNSSATKVSIVVGVALLGDRGSVGFMKPAFKASDISKRPSTILADIPI